MKTFFTLVLYQPLYNLLMFFVWLFPGHSIGLAIIALTLIIRTALLPLSLKSARAQVKMQALQPKINKLRKEVTDQQEQGKALMELYKKEDVSPFGSCLIALIQLPILIILYRVFKAGLGTDTSMLYSFVPLVSHIQTHFLGFDLASVNKIILPILAAGTQFVLSYMTLPQKKKSAGEDAGVDPMAAMSKQMMFMFPLTTLVFARSMPAALVLYWIVTTLFSIGQQIYINLNIKKELVIVEEEIEELDQKVGKPVEEVVEKEFEQPAKKDFMSKMIDKKLQKEEKKSGVEITIRKKK